MTYPATTRNKRHAQGEVRPAGRSLSYRFRVADVLLRAFFCLLFFCLLSCTQLFAQCATCRAGGQCAQNVNGKCMANRTFWGYYQSNWRKWPSVAAAEQAAAFEAQHKQSPSSAAPSVVLPKPEDEGREGNAAGGNQSQADTEDTTDSPNDNISPRRTKPQDTEEKSNTPFDETKQLLPEPSPVRPKLPGADLDDPAPVLPVDPNDSVPSLPPTLRDMKPPADEKLDLDDLFKPPATTVPKASGEAAKPRSNAPAEASMTPAERTAEYIRRRREHAERNRQYMKEKYANAVKKPAGRTLSDPQAAGQKAASTVTPANATEAAANSASTRAASLDELTALERLEAANAEIPPRTLPAEKTSAASTGEPAQEEATATPSEETTDEAGELEVEEPDLLLSPTDKAAQNPLRENIDHARYAARMFTPQLRSTGDSSTSTAAGLRGAVNPLRANSSASAYHQTNNLREVTPASYEAEVPTKDAASTATQVTSPMPIATEEVKLSPIPVDDVLPTPAVAAGSSLPANEQPSANEEAAAPVTVQRESSPASNSPSNALRDDSTSPMQRSLGNPLREGSSGNGSGQYQDRGVSLPAKSPGTGRYMTTLAGPPPAATEQPSQPVQPEPVAPPMTLGTANPLRSGL